MGGNVFPGQTVRMTKPQFLGIRQRAVDILRSNIEIWGIPFRVEPILSFEDKESHGDIDILFAVEYPNGWQDGNVYQRLKKTVKAVKDIKKNGPVISCLWYDSPTRLHVQIDFIEVQSEFFDFSKGYFDFNDLGNLIGKAAHFGGFKLGHDGLWYILRDGTYLIETILLSRDWSEALSFLGYDPEDYQKDNFKTIEDVYRFAYSSKYTSPTIYDLSKLSHDQRIRDRKRKTYTGFLTWIQEQEGANAFEVGDRDALKSEMRDAFFKKAFIAFPEFGLKYQAAKSDWEKTKRVKEKWNGNFVSSVIDVHGKPLGVFMDQFKKHITEEYGCFKDWVLSSSQEDIESEVKKFHGK